MERKKSWFFPKMPQFRVPRYEDITGLRGGCDVRTRKGPNAHGFKANQIGDWCMNVEGEEVEGCGQGHKLDAAVTALTLGIAPLGVGEEPEVEIAVGCSALSSPPSDDNSSIGIAQRGTRSVSERFDSTAMKLCNQVLHCIPTLEVQTAHLDTRAASISNLPQELGDTTAWIQYQTMKGMGGKLIDSESVFSLPRWLSVKEEVATSGCHTQLAFLSVSDLFLAKFLATSFSPASLFGLRLYSSLPRALTLSGWLCPTSPQTTSHSSWTACSPPHNSTTCDCAIKARRIIICVIVPGAVERKGDELVVREGCGGGIVPIRAELFAWGGTFEEERAGRFAQWVRSEVEEWERWR